MQAEASHMQIPERMGGSSVFRPSPRPDSANGSGPNDSIDFGQGLIREAPVPGGHQLFWASPDLFGPRHQNFKTGVGPVAAGIGLIRPEQPLLPVSDRSRG